MKSINDLNKIGHIFIFIHAMSHTPYKTGEHIKWPVTLHFWFDFNQLWRTHAGRRVIIVILMDRTGILNIPHCKESRIEALINDCAARDDLGATYSAKCRKK